jgi:hypothetical protein
MASLRSYLPIASREALILLAKVVCETPLAFLKYAILSPILVMIKPLNV